MAGTGTYGYNGDGPATSSQLRSPNKIAVDVTGNIFIADTHNNLIRKVDVSTSYMTTVAGNARVFTHAPDGSLATSTYITTPTGVAVDAKGNIYYSDYYASTIFRVARDTGYLTTVASSAQGLSYQNGIALDVKGNLYVADSGNNLVRIIDAHSGALTTVAGTVNSNGYTGDKYPATKAQLNNPQGVAVDMQGNLYIADASNHAIRMVDMSSSPSLITTIAGNGIPGYSGDGKLAKAAQLNYPYDVAVDLEGNIYIADSSNKVIRLITKSTGIITTIINIFSYGISTDIKGRVYVVNDDNSVIYMLTPKSAPTFTPTSAPTFAPTFAPTSAPTFTPTPAPTLMPTPAPTFTPTNLPASVCMMPPPPPPPPPSKKCTNLRKSTTQSTCKICNK